MSTPSIGPSACEVTVPVSAEAEVVASARDDPGERDAKQGRSDEKRCETTSPSSCRVSFGGKTSVSDRRSSCRKHASF